MGRAEDATRAHQQAAVITAEQRHNDRLTRFNESYQKLKDLTTTYLRLSEERDFPHTGGLTVWNGQELASWSLFNMSLDDSGVEGLYLLSTGELILRRVSDGEFCLYEQELEEAKRRYGTAFYDGSRYVRQMLQSLDMVERMIAVLPQQ